MWFDIRRSSKESLGCLGWRVKRSWYKFHNTSLKEQIHIKLIVDVNLIPQNIWKLLYWITGCPHGTNVKIQQLPACHCVSLRVSWLYEVILRCYGLTSLNLRGCSLAPLRYLCISGGCVSFWCNTSRFFLNSKQHQTTNSDICLALEIRQSEFGTT